jgi:hypothetical protein
MTEFKYTHTLERSDPWVVIGSCPNMLKEDSRCPIVWVQLQCIPVDPANAEPK